ncbi:hypothetical protein [Sorangium sp. So ce861]|uniref:hypothetical protein n=1 Tax=Sorangium sp. So ce861 TaxID=3133323 RepID=UPI003F63A01D
MSKPLPLETYATVLAHLLHRGTTPAAAVLARLQVSAEDFHRADEHWTAELAQSLTKRRGMLAMTFASTFSKARRELGLLGSIPGDATISRQTPTPAQPAELPSFMRAVAPADASGGAWPASPAEPAPAPAPLSQLEPEGTVPLGFFVGSAGLPFQAASPTPPLPTTPSPERRAHDQPSRASGATAVGSPTEPATAPLPSAHDAHLPVPLDWYAALAVELAEKPADPAALLARFGVANVMQQRQIEAAMQAFLDRDPNLRARYQALVTQYYSTLMRKRA